MKNLITIADIRNAGPCYDPIRYMKEDQVVTPLEILNAKHVPLEDRMWALLTIEGILSDKEARLFTVWNARYALSLIDSKYRDPRSVNAVNVAEKFANGEATEEELENAKNDAQEAWEDAWDSDKNTWQSTWHCSVAAWEDAQDAAFESGFENPISNRRQLNYLKQIFEDREQTN